MGRRDTLEFGIDTPLARPLVRKFGQELLEGLFSCPVSGLNGFIEDQ
jgi:hypothetical protein